MNKDMQLNINEAIYKIQEVYHAHYDSNNGLDGCFDVYDQLLACEAVAEATPVKEHHYQENERTNENACVNGMVNDSCKRRANPQLTQYKRKVISKLKACNYKTPPIETARLLEELFSGWKSQVGHWQYITQNWSARAINRVIARITKLHQTGQITIKNPAAYFTFLIKFRKKKIGNKYQ